MRRKFVCHPFAQIPPFRYTGGLVRLMVASEPLRIPAASIQLFQVCHELVLLLG